MKETNGGFLVRSRAKQASFFQFFAFVLPTGFSFGICSTRYLNTRRVSEALVSLGGGVWALNTVSDPLCLQIPRLCVKLVYVANSTNPKHTTSSTFFCLSAGLKHTFYSQHQHKHAETRSVPDQQTKSGSPTTYIGYKYGPQPNTQTSFHFPLVDLRTP